MSSSRTQNNSSGRTASLKTVTPLAAVMLLAFVLVMFMTAEPELVRSAAGVVACCRPDGICAEMSSEECNESNGVRVPMCLGHVQGSAMDSACTDAASARRTLGSGVSDAPGKKKHTGVRGRGHKATSLSKGSNQPKKGVPHRPSPPATPKPGQASVVRAPKAPPVGRGITTPSVIVHKRPAAAQPGVPIKITAPLDLQQTDAGKAGSGEYFGEFPDLCQDAMRVEVPAQISDSTLQATVDNAPPCGTATAPTAPGMWYRIKGTGNRITATTCTSPTDYDTQISVFRDNCLGLICVDGNNDTPGFNEKCVIGESSVKSTVSWCSEEGQEYLILVHGYQPEAGNYGLEITDNGDPCSDPPSFGAGVGVCCLRGACDAMITYESCLEQGGSWLEGYDCDPNCCPQPYTGQTDCTDAIVVSVPVNGTEVTFSGDNSNAITDNCLGQPVQWEGFSIDSCADVFVDYCCTDPSANTVYPFLNDNCPECSLINATDYSWTGGLYGCDDLNNFRGLWASLPPGAYHYPIYSGDVGSLHGPYQLHVTAYPCTQGACCLNGICVDDFGGTTSRLHCQEMGGTWFENRDCNQGFICPGAFGACCDDSTGICTDNIQTESCQPPLRFAVGTLCSDMEPPCAGPTEAACCVFGDCVTATQAACEDEAGIWLEDKSCDTYMCPDLPDCPDNLLLGQLPYLPPDSWTFGVSDTDFPGGNVLRYENYFSVNGPVCDLHWWGVGYGSGAGACTENPMNFIIKFYEPGGAVPFPGNEVCSYTATVMGTPTGWEYSYVGELYEYSADLPTCCRLFTGWVSIQATGGDTGCQFWWLSSPDGDGMSCFHDGTNLDCSGTSGDSAYDLSLCLTAATARLGACCVDGTCVGITTEANCVELFGGIWYDGQLCSTVECPLPRCEPLADGTDCTTSGCDFGTSLTCEPRCANFEPQTGAASVTDCACRNPSECRVQLSTPGSGTYDPCVVPDNGNGTVTLPPQGCDYLSPQEVHLIIDGLDPGTTIELDPIHMEFICLDDPTNFCSVPLAPGMCEGRGGSLGGHGDCFDSTLDLTVSGTGALTGFNRHLSVPISCEVHTGPRNPGDAIQSFSAEMYRLQGELFGDPDFCTFKVIGGTDYGLPSPGQTTLTRLPSGDFNVDSFFDITYQIEFEGCPLTQLANYQGTTTATIRMQTGTGSMPPMCVATCPPGMVCKETLTENSDGTVDICCDCVTQPPQCGPTTDGSSCEQAACPLITDECVPTVVHEVLGPAPSFEVLECDCLPEGACHVAFGAGGPAPVWCEGTCPEGYDCTLIGSDSNQDGVDDTFRCRCIPVPKWACCFRDGSCLDLSATDCRTRGGKPQSEGIMCADIECPQPVTEIDVFPETVGQILLEVPNGIITPDPGLPPTDGVYRSPAQV
ncbi:MAG: hypothetical protein JSU63_04430, partial [Phycisphaerales bacterium]